MKDLHYRVATLLEMERETTKIFSYGKVNIVVGNLYAKITLFHKQYFYPPSILKHSLFLILRVSMSDHNNRSIDRDVFLMFA